MLLNADPVSVRLEDISLADAQYVITFGRSCGSLAASIARAGLINPPILAKAPEQAPYRIVCGYLRVRAAEQIGWKDMPARIMPSGTDDLRLLELSIHDNLCHRPLNPVEQAGAVRRLLGYLPEETVIEAWLPALGLSPSAKALDTCLRIDSLAQDIQEALVAGAMSARSAAELAALEPGDRQAVFGLFTSVHLSTSKQSEIIETCKDLALREGTSIQDILRAPEITAVLADRDPNPTHRGEQVRSFLRRCRYPRLAEKEEGFDALTKKLPRAGGVRLVAPQSFEGDTYRLEIDFSRPEALEKAAETVRRLAGDERLRGLLEERK